MRIKKIILSGFKSYLSQENFDDFHPLTNVIVGRNGSGKSNLIVAIRFVLSAEFQKLRTEERKQLLHFGQDNIVSGYVEIHFDNEDKRFPIDSSEVRLRRTIGVTKTEYYLNGRHIPAEDVMNLLESAGFSRSNPYYIVQQGKVQALSKMKPSERLDLLHEVAGTRVYDERRAESIKIMEESKSKKVKINEVLSFLDERLGELEREKDELKGYQALDKLRRVLEFTILNKELKEVTKRIEGLDETRTNNAKRIEKLHEESKEIYTQILNKEKEVKDITALLNQKMPIKENLEIELLGKEKSRARLELVLRSHKANSSDAANKREGYSKQFEKVEKEIEAVRKNLESITPQFHQAQEVEQKVVKEIAEKNRRLNELYAKKDWASQFSSSKERDEFIKKEVKAIKSAILSKQKQIESLNNEVEKISQDIKTEKEKIDNKDKIIEEFKAEREKLNEKFEELKIKRDKCFDKRKELWKEDTQIKAKIESEKTESKELKRKLYSTITSETARGINFLMEYKEKMKIEGVYAPVIELFTCAEEEMTAIEVAAKASLFNVVVDTDDTASKMLNLLNAQKAGRVTFMPLNKLVAREPTYPRTESTFPMIDRLDFSSTHRKAFLQIFSKTLICSTTLTEAANIARTHNVDCITLDGDKVNRKGALTGGFVDTRESRLAKMAVIRKKKQNIDELESLMQKVHKDLATTENVAARIVGEVQEIEKQRTKNKDDFESFQMEASSAIKKLLSFQNQLEEKRKFIKEAQNAIEAHEATVQSLNANLGTKLTSTLSRSEQLELETLISEVSSLQQSISELHKRRTEIELIKSSEESKLSDHLLPVYEELQKHLSAFAIEEEDVIMKDMKGQLKRETNDIKGISEQYSELEKETSGYSAKIDELNRAIEKLKEREMSENRKLQDESKTIEKSLNNRSLMISKRDEIDRKLKDIGSLSSKSLKRYRDAELNELVPLLHETKQKLKSFINVNKKAFDQYTNFHEQRKKLESKRKELDEGEEKIYELIKTLDQQKYRAIERTMKMVANYFEEVFRSLTGEGTAVLVMEQREEGSVAESEGPLPVSVPQYEGVDIRVSFTKSGKQQRMHQLSGGQQSLVSLALIFAIQRCDPAPFYIFDEIDAALDDNHRLSVAQMIRQQSEQNADKRKEEDTGERIQFILTTHRPELVQASHKQYLIHYMNKVSSLVTCSVEQALELLEGEEEPQPEPAAMPQQRPPPEEEEENFQE